MNPSEKPLSCMNSHSCCPSQDLNDPHLDYISRRKFIKVAGGSTLSVAALSGLSWSALAGSPLEEQFGMIRKALAVKPILVYSTPEYKHQLSWRSWGGIQTEKDENYSPPLDNEIQIYVCFSFPGHGRERKIMQPSHTPVPVCYIPRIDVACGYCKIPYTTRFFRKAQSHPLMAPNRSFRT